MNKVLLDSVICEQISTTQLPCKYFPINLDLSLLQKTHIRTDLELSGRTDREFADGSPTQSNDVINLI